MSKPYKAVITDLITDCLEPEKRILGDLANVEALNAYSEDELVGRIEDADAVLVYHNLGLSSGSIRRLTRCKIIVRAGVGIDNGGHAVGWRERARDPADAAGAAVLRPGQLRPRAP